MNPAKAREIVELLGDVPFDVHLLGERPDARLPEETGQTYADNALVKARTAAQLTGMLALGDDSGLEVDALGGGPALRSARFGGAGLDDAGRCRRLLEALQGVPEARRTARFRCVIALVHPRGAEHVVEGVAGGVILTEGRGRGGFGYDPLFYYPLLGRTFAELTAAEKARVSHRGLALRAAGRLLTECYTATSDS